MFCYTNPVKSRNVVNASEVGEYVFCKRAWWLSFMEMVSVTEQMVQGTAAHERLNETQYTQSRFSKYIWLILIFALILFALVLFFVINTLI
jgi:CRISPR/Cas system-associated exonuclease Cas4 (RecB family)